MYIFLIFENSERHFLIILQNHSICDYLRFHSDTCVSISKAILYHAVQNHYCKPKLCHLI